MSKFLWWCRISGTIIPAIWWQILLLLLFSAAVTCTEYFVDFLHKDFPSTLINIIGTVIGLLLTFRTDTAYNRYWEGRQLWSTMTQEMRKLTRAIWSGVKETESRDIVEKKTALNLCIAFVIGTKHYVRDEYSYDYEDYEDSLSYLPKFSTPSSNLPLSEQKGGGKADFQYKAYDKATPTNIPVEISYYLISYIKHLEEEGLADSWAIETMQSSINSLVDCLAGFERILRTPMPLAYSIHLQSCVWLYLLSIPFQIIGDVGPWWTIPIVGFAGFCLLGILAIGFEIENPFGYDDNDLPLDDFCGVIKLEVQKILMGKPPKAREWMYYDGNRPFGPMCSLTSKQLAELPFEETRDILKSVAQTRIHSTDFEFNGKAKKSGLRKKSKIGYQSF